MPVYIHDADALDRLASVEGDRWRLYQEQHFDNAYGFYAYQRGWNEYRKAVGELGSGLTDEGSMWEGGALWIGGGDGAIYGEGGYTRYAVRSDGEIVLLAWSARDDKRERARTIGFTIV